MALFDEAAVELAALDRAQLARSELAQAVVGLPPVHTVVWPADRLTPDTVSRIGVDAWTALARYGKRSRSKATKARLAFTQRPTISGPSHESPMLVGAAWPRSPTITRPTGKASA